jgi:hypothetical protein
MKTIFVLFLGLVVTALSSCALVVESEITYNSAKISRVEVTKVMDGNSGKFNLGRVEIPDQPHTLAYADRRLGPGARIATFADLDLGKISISEGMTDSPSPRMRAYENGLRSDLSLLGASPR